MCRPIASPLRRAHLGLLCLSLVACNRPTPAAQVTSEAVQPGEKLPAPTPKPAPKAAPKPAPKLAPKPAAPNPVREQPAPTQPKAVGAVELIMATPEVPADIVIHNAVAKASEDGKDVLVYVGASWCAPCVRFKAAAKAGELDAALPGLRLLVFDADTDTDRLGLAGYTWTYVPLFVRPGVNGRSSGLQIAGVPNKGSTENDLIIVQVNYTGFFRQLNSFLTGFK